MWKKSVIFILSVMMFTAFSLHAAGANVPSYDVDGVSFIAEKDIYKSSDHISLSLKNITPHNLSFGTPFTIERWDNGKWQETSLTDGMAFTEQLIILPPGQTYKTTVYLNMLQDSISPGVYQIVKNVHMDGESYNIGAPFQIVEKEKKDTVPFTPLPFYFFDYLR